jgi:hypothetical protein
MGKRDDFISKEYLKKLLKYISNVYDFSKKIKQLKDERVNAKISTATISFVLFIGFMMKIRSFNQLDDWLEYGDFKKLVPKNMRLPRIDVVRDSLKCIHIKGLEYMHDNIIKTTKANKLVRKGTIDGYSVVAFDGVELFESTKKNCPGCLIRVINGISHYFHRSVVAAYVGKDPHIVIGQEMLKPKNDSANKGEGELTGAKRLLEKLNQKHHHFADVIVYDALACNAPWINAVKSYNMDAVIRVKDKRLNIVKDAMSTFKRQSADLVWDIQKNNLETITISAWTCEVKMAGVNDTVKFVKFLEKTKNSKTNKVEFHEICIVTTAKDMPLETLRKIIHARWGIENNIFRQLKTQWHMNHCFIHDENGLEATLMFMIISFNLMQLFFFRRLKNFRQRKLLQVEIIERMIKEMVVFDAKGKYLMDTG